MSFFKYFDPALGKKLTEDAAQIRLSVSKNLSVKFW